MIASRRYRLSQSAYRRLHGVTNAAAWTDTLRWVQWAPPGSADDAWLTIGLDAAVPVAQWPHSLPAADGTPVPVRCVPVETDPPAQAWVRARNAANDFGNGTLGGFVKPRGTASDLLLLTAGHVLAGSGTARLSDPIPLHIGDRLLGHGRLHDWAPAFAGNDRDTAIDAGTVRVDAELGAALQAHSAIPLGWSDAAANDSLLLLLTRGLSLEARAIGALSTFMRVGDSGLMRYRLVDGVCYHVDQGSRVGDSGAPIWDRHRRLVAIHTGAAPAGAAGNAMATPIGRILRWFGLDLVVRTGSPVAVPSTARPLPELPPPAGVEASASEADTAIDVLARTMWGEARGEGPEGMAAVAHVVLNRRDAKRWWGRSIEAVCQKPYQFSCWNESDPNRGAMMRLTRADAVFATALRIAGDLCALAPADRARADISVGATHYHAGNLRPLPNWARDRMPCARIGRHVFYRGIS